MILQRLQSHLSTLKAIEMRAVAAECGVALSGTKAVLFDRLLTHFRQLHQQGTKLATFNPEKLLPDSVLSFDLGYRNLAFVQLTKNKEVKQWKVNDLGLDNFHASSMAPVVRQYVHDNIRPLMPQLGHILIEQQRSRSNGGHNILEHTLRVNTVEALLWCSLEEITQSSRKEKAIAIQPIPRPPVDKLFQDELERVWHGNDGSDDDKIAKESALLKKNKKRACAVMVSHWLDGGRVTCSEDLITMFRQTKKKDDLSDCLMQAAAWYQWRENTIKYLTLFQ